MIGLVIAVVALHRSVEGKGADLARSSAKVLADRVKDGEAKVLRQLLGGDRPRINLTFVRQSATARGAAAPPAGHTFGDGLPVVLEYYHSTRNRRLAITGAAGAGKTVLALELMLALIEDRGEDDRVPVRISLAQWNTTQPLSSLLVQRLVDAYSFSAREAAGLVAHGKVLPVLDGLDEMDPLLADGTPNPQAPRARAALEKLNDYQDGLDAGALVLTCRTEHYDALALSSDSRLIDAARVAIAPIDTHRAVDYLRTRILDTPRWQPLIDHLDTQPASPLATTLSTPWRLCLTASVYHRDGNPSELLHHTDGPDLDEHLLSRYLPATIANTHNPHHYQPDDVHRWLHHLTRHLAGTPTSAPATDITLHQLWTLAGTTRVRIADFLITLALTVTLILALILGTQLASAEPVLQSDVVFSVAFAVFISIFAFRPMPRPNRLRITRGTRQDRFAARFWAKCKTWFIVGLMIGLAVGITTGTANILSGTADGFQTELVGGLVSGLALGIGTGLIGGFMGGLTGGFADGFKTWFGIWFTVVFVLTLALEYEEKGEPALGIVNAIDLGLVMGFVTGLAGGLVGGFMRGFKGEPVTMANPRAIIRDDIVHGLTLGFLAGILGGFLFSLPGDTGGYTQVLSFGGVVGVSVLFASGFAGAARRYGVFLLCSRGKLPFRLGVFLDWAVTAGLLRYSGPGYQFRHRELQQWLSQHPRP